MKDFVELVSTLEKVHEDLQGSAFNAVNRALTMRNWLMGFYIVEFEQAGEDRAKYGAGVVVELGRSLNHIKGLDERSLRRFRQFYLQYPHLEEPIRGTLSPELMGGEIRGTLSPELTQETEIVKFRTELPFALQMPGEKLISRLSYSHFELLLNIEDPLKRVFYELECIKGTWSVRELKRQINSMFYERSGLSNDPKKVSEWVQQKISPQAPTDIVKNLYAFEFLGLSKIAILEESDIENALLDQLQHFLMELGNGFCLEGRQKRILIGETYYFVDLVFYHRILKCHVLLELKLGEFDHTAIGQLNTYLNYYKMEMLEPGDNPPVGILLVAEKDQALVQYATAGMDQNLFVKEYLVQLPSKEELQRYVTKELNRLK